MHFLSTKCPLPSRSPLIKAITCVKDSLCDHKKDRKPFMVSRLLPEAAAVPSHLTITCICRSSDNKGCMLPQAVNTLLELRDVNCVGDYHDYRG